MTPRVALAVAGLAALALPLPEATILGIGLTAAGAVALGASVARPGSAGPVVLIVAAALSWLAGPTGQLHEVRLVALALAVAVVHSAAALAAVVPARSRVPAGLLLRWAGWTVLATAAGVGVASGTALLSGTGPVAGTVAAVLLVGVAGGGAVWLGVRGRGTPASAPDDTGG